MKLINVKHGKEIITIPYKELDTRIHKPVNGIVFEQVVVAEEKPKRGRPKKEEEVAEVKTNTEV